MIEQLKYTTIKKQTPFELRQYQAFSMVESSDKDLQSYQGFRLAFDFIQGDNLRGQKISMTTPVINQINEIGVQTTAFVMPTKMNYDDVPLPLNQNLHKVLVPERICAVYRFSFNPKMEIVREYEKALRAWIKQEEYTIIGD